MLELGVVTNLFTAVHSSSEGKVCSHFYHLESGEKALVITPDSQLTFLSVFWPVCKEVHIPSCWGAAFFTEV